MFVFFSLNLYMCFYLQVVKKRNFKLSSEEKDSLCRGLIKPSAGGKREWRSYTEIWPLLSSDPAFDSAYNKALAAQMGKTFNIAGKQTNFDDCDADSLRPLEIGSGSSS